MSSSSSSSSMSGAPRFVADAMLGSLARKLRIFGCNTLYFKDGTDSELEALARAEDRILLTSDRDLVERSSAKGIRAVLVEGRTDQVRLLSVMRQLGGARVLGMGSSRSRCAVCNGELEVIPRREMTSQDVPEKVLARHRLFYRCTLCSRFYWRGRHWYRLRRLYRSLDTKDLTRNVR